MSVKLNVALFQSDFSADRCGNEGGGCCSRSGKGIEAKAQLFGSDASEILNDIASICEITSRKPSVGLKI